MWAALRAIAVAVTVLVVAGICIWAHFDEDLKPACDAVTKIAGVLFAAALLYIYYTVHTQGRYGP